jgi:hypothetical protein
MLSYLLKILIFVLGISLCLLFLQIRRAIKIRKELKELMALRNHDLIETNKLFIEKSENELKLFFQFETVLEELVKMMKKSNADTSKMIEGHKEIKIILEYIIKK